MKKNHVQYGLLMDTQNAPRFGRRNLFWLAGGLVSALVLPGCGSGNDNPNPIPTPTPAPAGAITLIPAPRATPTGDLANQINQVSESIDQLSLSHAGLSNYTADFQQFVNTSRAVTRAEDDSAFQQLIETVEVSLPVVHLVYEQVADALLMLDQTGYLGDSVTRTMVLTGTNSVANPQWIAAMMERNFHVLNVFGNLMVYYQTIGLSSLSDLVKAQNDSDSILVAYFLLTEVFNSWVDGVAQRAGVVAKPEWKLAEIGTINTSAIPAQLNRISSIVFDLPFGPGYLNRSASRLHSNRVASRDISTFVSTVLDKASNFGTSTLGSYVDALFSKDPTTGKYAIDPQKLTKFADRVKDAAKDQLKDEAKNVLLRVADYLIKDIIPGVNGEAVACALNVSYHTYKLALSVAEIGTGVGAVFGLLGLPGSFKEVADDLEECADPWAKAIGNLFKPDADKLDAINSNVSSTRNIPALTNPNRAECDQLNRAGVRATAITIPSGGSTARPALSQTPDAPVMRQIISGVVDGPSSGLVVADAFPRTFSNVQAAAANLLQDHANRNPSTVQSQVNGDTLSFFASDFATLIRREASSTSAVIPSITSADLLCTSPGFILARNDAPKDLTTLPSLPQLRAIGAGLGTGVHSDVS